MAASLTDEQLAVRVRDGLAHFACAMGSGGHSPSNSTPDLKLERGKDRAGKGNGNPAGNTAIRRCER